MLLFENYSLSSSKLSFKNIRRYTSAPVLITYMINGNVNEAENAN